MFYLPHYLSTDPLYNCKTHGALGEGYFIAFDKIYCLRCAVEIIENLGLKPVGQKPIVATSSIFDAPSLDAKSKTNKKDFDVFSINFELQLKIKKHSFSFEFDATCTFQKLKSLIRDQRGNGIYIATDYDNIFVIYVQDKKISASKDHKTVYEIALLKRFDKWLYKYWLK